MPTAQEIVNEHLERSGLIKPAQPGPMSFSKIPELISKAGSAMGPWVNPADQILSEINQPTIPPLAASHAPATSIRIPPEAPSHTPGEPITVPPGPDEMAADVKSFNKVMGEINDLLGGPSPVADLKIPEHSVELSTLVQDARAKMTEWDASLKKILGDVEAKSASVGEESRKVYDDMKKGLLELRKFVMSKTFEPDTPPKPPEIQSTEKNLGSLAAIIPGIMAIASIISGGQSGVNFADMYNGMVDSWRSRDYESFVKNSQKFNQELTSFEQKEQGRFRGHQEALNQAIRGMDINVQLGDLELKKIREPLDQATRALELTHVAQQIMKDTFEMADKAETKDYMTRLKEYELNFNKRMSEKTLKLEQAKLKLEIASKAIEIPSKIEERMATTEMRRAMKTMYSAKGAGEELKTLEQRKMFMRSFQVPSGEKIDEATWREDPVHGLTVTTKSGKVFGEK